MHKMKTALGRAFAARNSRRGAYLAVATALAIAAVILLNLLLGRLSPSFTELDMTSNDLYQVSDMSKEFLATVEEDVTIHVLAAEESVDSRILRFMEQYAALSPHLTLTFTDPVVFPSVLTAYGVESDTVVVECEATGLQDTFALSEVIGIDMTAYYYYGTTQETDFDCEGLLTSAVNYVLSDVSITACTTTGHGEGDLPASARELMEKNHFTLSQVNLLTDGGIPADCDLLISYTPTADLADDELALIRAYLAGGGKVVYLMAPDNTLVLPNFEALMADYLLSPTDGLIADAKAYYGNTPYVFFPTLDTAAQAAGSLTGEALLLVDQSRGLTVAEPPEGSTLTVESFLTTSEEGYNVTNEAQTAGTYTVAAATSDSATGGRLTVYAAASIIDPTITDSFTNLSNLTLFLNSVSVELDESSSPVIEPVSLEEPRNTVTTTGLWSLLFIILIPLALLLFGGSRALRRRKL